VGIEPWKHQSRHPHPAFVYHSLGSSTRLGIRRCSHRLTGNSLTVGNHPILVAGAVPPPSGRVPPVGIEHQSRRPHPARPYHSPAIPPARESPLLPPPCWGFSNRGKPPHSVAAAVSPPPGSVLTVGIKPWWHQSRRDPDTRPSTPVPSSTLTVPPLFHLVGDPSPLLPPR
jgi:hypothetical protein